VGGGDIYNADHPVYPSTGFKDHGLLASRSLEINRIITPGSAMIINEGALVGYLLGTNPVFAHLSAAVVTQHRFRLHVEGWEICLYGPRSRPCAHILSRQRIQSPNIRATIFDCPGC
jgi:hypothetical protein